MVVSYRRVVLATVPALLRSAGGDFVAVVVSHTSSGLSVLYDGELLIGNLTIERWMPEPGWQFGWGARKSSSVDVHLLAGITIDSGGRFEDDALGVEVTLNGQQFSASQV